LASFEVGVSLLIVGLVDTFNVGSRMVEETFGCIRSLLCFASSSAGGEHGGVLASFEVGVSFVIVGLVDDVFNVGSPVVLEETFGCIRSLSFFFFGSSAVGGEDGGRLASFDTGVSFVSVGLVDAFNVGLRLEEDSVGCIRSLLGLRLEEDSFGCIRSLLGLRLEEDSFGCICSLFFFALSAAGGEGGGVLASFETGVSLLVVLEWVGAFNVGCRVVEETFGCIRSLFCFSSSAVGGEDGGDLASFETGVSFVIVGLADTFNVRGSFGSIISLTSFFFASLAAGREDDGGLASFERGVSFLIVRLVDVFTVIGCRLVGKMFGSIISFSFFASSAAGGEDGGVALASFEEGVTLLIVGLVNAFNAGSPVV
jgi:hypothetical protein